MLGINLSSPSRTGFRHLPASVFSVPELCSFRVAHSPAQRANIGLLAQTFFGNGSDSATKKM
jgi:hypothetical protein